MSAGSLFEELRKRRAIQVAAIYGAVAWAFTEIIVTVVEQLFLPRWVSTLAVILFVAGFPVAMFLAWTFDITADGIQRTTVSSRRGKASIAASMMLLVLSTSSSNAIRTSGTQQHRQWRYIRPDPVRPPGELP